MIRRLRPPAKPQAARRMIVSPWGGRSRGAGCIRRGGRVWADAEYTVPLTALPLFGQSRVVLHQRHAEPVDPWRNIP